MTFRFDVLRLVDEDLLDVGLDGNIICSSRIGLLLPYERATDDLHSSKILSKARYLSFPDSISQIQGCFATCTCSYQVYNHESCSVPLSSYSACTVPRASDPILWSSFLTLSVPNSTLRPPVRWGIDTPASYTEPVEVTV